MGKAERASGNNETFGTPTNVRLGSPEGEVGDVMGHDDGLDSGRVPKGGTDLGSMFGLSGEGRTRQTGPLPRRCYWYNLKHDGLVNFTPITLTP